jgi:hypothetical protein
LALRAGPRGAISASLSLTFGVLKMNKNIQRGLVAVGILAVVGVASATVPAAAGTAITTAGTDMLEAIGMVIAAMVAVWGLKKLGQKMGWL